MCGLALVSGGRNGEYQELTERPPALRLLANGSLFLQSVTEESEGSYLCQANNSIGSPLGKVVQLKVNCKSPINIGIRIKNEQKTQPPTEPVFLPSA